MAIWSSLRANVAKLHGVLSKNTFLGGNIRSMSGGHGEHRTMAITPSRFQFKKFKDLLHFYALIGIIPLGLLTLYANLYIGPAKLAPIPDDYVPKHWEYYRHPITRWLARYLFTNPQQEYEKYLHLLYEEDEKMKMRALEKRVLDLMAERHDYQSYYYYPVDAKYYRRNREMFEEMTDMAGKVGRIEGPE